MRSIALLVLATTLAACAHNSPPQSGLEAERDACRARVAASHEFQALEGRLYPDQFGTMSSGAKATPTEAALMSTLHQEYLRPCQEIELEIAGRTHPALPPLYNGAAAEADANIARLVSFEITWGEYAAKSVAIQLGLNAQLAAAKADLGLPSLNGLDEPG